MTSKSLKDLFDVLRTSFTQRTIARDIALRMIAWTTLSVIVAGMIFVIYEFVTDRASTRLQTKETAQQIAQVVSQSVWTFNESEIKSIVNSYMLSNEISAIKIFDEENKSLFAQDKSNFTKNIKASASIAFRDKKIGRVEVYSTTSWIYKKIANTIIFLGFILLLAIAAAIISIAKMLYADLQLPLTRLGNAIRRIAAGNYHEKIPQSPQLELTRITEEVNFMANKIALREHQIRQKIQEQTILKAEISIAETLQRSMVASRGTGAGRRIAQFYQPMQNLSGDWMTVIECAGGRVIYAMVGDVTGHGIPQGLVTMVAFGAVQTLRPLIQQNPQGFTPAVIMNILRSTMISLLNECNLAMTVAIVRIDLDQRELRICNAGHPFPLALSEGLEGISIRPLTTKPQPPFGYELLTRSIAQVAYTEAKIDLVAKEMICLFSDGLTEARSREAKAFQRPFIQLLKNVKQFEPAPHLLDRITKSLHTHLKDAVADDDICLMLIDTRMDLDHEKVA